MTLHVTFKKGTCDQVTRRDIARKRMSDEICKRCEGKMPYEWQLDSCLHELDDLYEAILNVLLRELLQEIEQQCCTAGWTPGRSHPSGDMAIKE